MNFIYFKTITHSFWPNKQKFKSNILFTNSYQITVKVYHALKSTKTCLFLQNTAYFGSLCFDNFSAILKFQISRDPASREFRVREFTARVIDCHLLTNAYSI